MARIRARIAAVGPVVGLHSERVPVDGRGARCGPGILSLVEDRSCAWRKPVSLPETVAASFGGPLRERLVALRRELHREPELSFKESATTDRLLSALSAAGLSDVRRTG